MDIRLKNIAMINNNENVSMETAKKKSDGSEEAFAKEFSDNIQNGAADGAEQSVTYQKSTVTPTELFEKLRTPDVNIIKDTGVVVVDVKHLSIQDCDQYKIDIINGYTMKAKKNADNTMYVETKYEDGNYKAYQVDLQSVKDLNSFALQISQKQVSSDSITASNSSASNAAANNVSDANMVANKATGSNETTEKIVKSGLDILKKYDTHGKYVPYSYLADECGVISYKGVAYVCSPDDNSICLGDMSETSKVLSIKLSGGGNLKVNIDDVGALAHSIGMFNSKDQLLIMQAISIHAKTKNAVQDLQDYEEKIVNRVFDNIINKN